MLLTEYMEFHALARPASPMLTDKELSFQASVAESKSIAAWLTQEGISQGDRVAILGCCPSDQY